MSGKPPLTLCLEILVTPLGDQQDFLSGTCLGQLPFQKSTCTSVTTFSQLVAYESFSCVTSYIQWQRYYSCITDSPTERFWCRP